MKMSVKQIENGLKNMWIGRCNVSSAMSHFITFWSLPSTYVKPNCNGFVAPINHYQSVRNFPGSWKCDRSVSLRSLENLSRIFAKSNDLELSVDPVSCQILGNSKYEFPKIRSINDNGRFTIKRCAMYDFLFKMLVRLDMLNKRSSWDWRAHFDFFA